MQRTSEEYYLECDCFELLRQLVKVCKDIFSRTEGPSEWTKFEQFMTANMIGNNPYRRFLKSDGTLRCSVKICSSIVEKLEEFKRHNTLLSTLLVDFLTMLNCQRCGAASVHWLLNFEKMNYISAFSENSRIPVELRGWLLNKDVIELLMKFGFLSSLPGDFPFMKQILNYEFQTFMIRMDDSPISLELKVGKAIRMIKDIFFRYSDRENYRRMFLAIRALLGVNQFPTIDCLRMYFTASPDVLLSNFEVRSVLYVCLKLTNEFHMFDDYCELIDKYMSDYPAQVEPRKLTHLARCQIRQNLALSPLPLPSAVEMLYLPKVLKTFIIGEIFDLPRKREKLSVIEPLTLSELEIMFLERSGTYGQPI